MQESCNTETKTVSGNFTGKVHEREMCVIRFAGDSGDGIQLIGDQFTSTSTFMGENVATLPDYPPEIRAPAGTVAGVSGFQVCFGTAKVYTPGDKADVLVALNPAALKVNISIVREGGLILVNEGTFGPKDLEKAGYATSPLDSAELSQFTVVRINMTEATRAALEGSGLGMKQVDRCKNLLALGLCYVLFQRDTETTIKWLKQKFGSKPEILESNLKALGHGIKLAESAQFFPYRFRIKKSTETRKAGVYRQVTGNTASALGLIAAAKRANRHLFLGSYPITPATDILQTLCNFPKQATVFQAEDEIAAIGSALGAAYGGSLAATSTSGPGFSLKSEFLNLAVIAELPLVVINVQRAGPSTGIPTKTEQADLLQALYGRHGESPLPVLAGASPSDCFDVVVEASRIAIKYMTPVVVLTDGYLANGSEIWRVPDNAEMKPFEGSPQPAVDKFLPYGRESETLARPWTVPGMTGFEHRLGGLEKQDGSGSPTHSAENHERMVNLRAAKIAGISKDIAPLEVIGDKDAELLVLGWGSTYGVIRHSVEQLRKGGMKLACLHLRHLNPFPPNLGAILKSYRRVLLPENNSGQLCHELRAEFLVDIEKFSKIQGLPFTADEISAKINSILGAKL